MSYYKLTELPEAERRESIYDLDQLIKHISGMDQVDKLQDAYLEIILCLANEIKDLKDGY